MLFPLNVGNSTKRATGRNHCSVRAVLCDYTITDGGTVLSDMTVPEVYTASLLPPGYKLPLCYVCIESVYLGDSAFDCYIQYLLKNAF
jgi:hypothetical protein